MSLPSTHPLRRAWYAANIVDFLQTSDNQVLAELVKASPFPIQQTQRDAWVDELSLLRAALADQSGKIYLEFDIPRMGHRIDALVWIRGILLVLEFKVGAKGYTGSDIDQALDYAIDLKYFHEGSHGLPVVPVLVATAAENQSAILAPHSTISGLFNVVRTNSELLQSVIQKVFREVPVQQEDLEGWENSRYCPSPTIIEAARSLYAGHGVADISRNDAGAINLQGTSEALIRIIEDAKARKRKVICFVTGVPGAGKTLVGLNIATKYNDVQSDLHSVFLSGNAPLVAILREALARDTVRRERLHGRRLRKGDARVRVKAFIQNVHHFRDECLKDVARPPIDHVALFDEAQRAWNRDQTASFMHRKKGVANFSMSEPEFLISCMDRRQDWAVIICLVGGGQEINTGEAGIGEWLEALQRSFHGWQVHISPHLMDSEYGARKLLDRFRMLGNVSAAPSLHLKVSLRSFRAERVSEFVKQVLDCEVACARDLLNEIAGRYPIALTRDLETAKQWLRNHASGSERYGIVVSSQAERLKPLAMDVRSPVDPVKWFLDGKDDVRSSYYLEDVATEFHVQGLELDWACLSWDGDFRHDQHGWQHFSFRGNYWQRVLKPERKTYLKNAYRVLLTRARQGMVIFVPRGNPDDPTRDPRYYDSTYQYLQSIGLQEL